MGSAEQWIQGVVEAYEHRLVRYCLRLVNDLDAARDIVQDCLLRLCRTERALIEDHLAEWLFTVCRNRAVDHLRKERRMHATDDASLDALPGPGADPTAAVQLAESAGALRDLVGRLPARTQEVLRLKFQEDLSYQAIARVTGLSVSNVGVILHNAIGALRAGMREGGAS